ncbi:MAG: dephospho-CoA kinase [Proteobacteria bacterium]|nr:dephospho-CoA kinase [Pseudomonadota bacterium]
MSVGLTGGIATGKSTVVDMLRAKGADVIDLDELARVVVEPGRPALDEVRRRFGEVVIAADGTLDRAALGRIVFDDEKARQDLEGILHPAISAEERRRSAEFARKNPRAIIIIDVPLLFELSLDGAFDTTILIYAPRAVQEERLMARDGFSPQEAQKRLDAQLGIEAKKARAGHVIDNNGPLRALPSEVDRVWKKLKAAEAEHFGEKVA